MSQFNVTARFWDKVDRRSQSECWEWTASKDRNGYGRIYIDGTNHTAHRLSWEIHNGNIPSGTQSGQPMCICHHCDNPPCVNPSHLFLGTYADNAIDRNHKGRNADTRGEMHGNAKLDDTKVRAIRRMYPSINQPTLAMMFGVTQTVVSGVVLRKTWSHVK